MNLSDKTILGVCVLPLLFLSACERSEGLGLELGSGSDETEIKFIEFDVEAKTVYIDSLRTDNTTSLIVGANQDPVFGSVSVKGYCEIRYFGGVIPADTLSPTGGTLYLKVGDLLSSNAFADMDIELRTIDDRIYESAVYLADEEVDVNDDVIGKLDLRAASDTKKLAIRLEDQLLDYLWNTAKSANNKIADMDLNIALCSDDPGGGLITINLKEDSTFFEMASVNKAGNAFKTFLRLNNPFHTVERDRTGSAMESLKSTGDVITTGETSYINSLAGSYTLLDLSAFNAFLKETPDMVINGAEFNFPAGEKKPNAVSERIETIHAYFETPKTVINGPGAIANVTTSALAPELEYAERNMPRTIKPIALDARSLVYKNQIALFSQFMIQNHRKNDRFLTHGFVLLPSPVFTVRQSTIKADNIKLRVFYTTLNP